MRNADHAKRLKQIYEKTKFFEDIIDKKIDDHAGSGWKGNLEINLELDREYGEALAARYRSAGFAAAWSDQTGDRMHSTVYGILKLDLQGK